MRGATNWGVSFLSLALAAPLVAQQPMGESPPLAMAPFDAAEAKRQQEVWARHLNVPVEATNTLGMKLRLIPPGEFLMGSPADEPQRQDDETQHRVRVSRPFYLGVYEVTQDEYARVMRRTPSVFAPGGQFQERVAGIDTERFPVELVSWDEAVDFCRRLSRREEAEYRLPTEAEWEYACRAGTTTPFHFGAENNGRQANANGQKPYGTSTPGPLLNRPCKVGSYAANPFGLHDMHGNVAEWCHDWYGKTYYDGQVGRTTTDPQGDETTQEFRTARGGSWFNVAGYTRSATRDRVLPIHRFGYIGFRVVKTP